MSKRESTADDPAIEANRSTTARTDEDRSTTDGGAERSPRIYEIAETRSGTAERETAGLTAETFESALAALLRRADRSNVETTRSLDVATGGERAEWMVEITRVERQP